jgi:integrase
VSRRLVTDTGPWRRVGHNLVRYAPSGKYFMRCRVAGRLHRKSLKTTVLSVAKLRLPDEIRKLREQAESHVAVVQGKMRMGNAVDVYSRQLADRADIKPRTKTYYAEVVTALLNSWPSLSDCDVTKISERDCRMWAARFSRDYSPSRFNAGLSVLRNVFNVAIEAGARFGNPANHVKRARVKLKKLKLPSRAQFVKFVEVIATGGSRDSQNCADLVQFLAFSGLRISEAKHVRWGDVDRDNKRLHVRGDPKTGTKNSETRFLPMVPDLQQLIEKLAAARNGKGPHSAVMSVSECQKSMDRAAKIVGMDRITHHDLRHLFATMCIESGVDIPTVSRWLGHKDGGALAMKVYGHLRDDHSAAQAQRVHFSP